MARDLENPSQIFLIRYNECLFFSTEVDLNKRIEYLSRAVVCVKSGEATSASDGSGDILHNLEEKMEVARVQVCPILQS